MNTINSLKTLHSQNNILGWSQIMSVLTYLLVPLSLVLLVVPFLVCAVAAKLCVLDQVTISELHEVAVQSLCSQSE